MLGDGSACRNAVPISKPPHNVMMHHSVPAHATPRRLMNKPNRQVRYWPNHNVFVFYAQWARLCAMIMSA
jgi:hypothetical protein